MNNTNIPSMAISKAISELADLYTNVINKKLPLSYVPSPFLWGAAGVGKSDGVTQFAAILETRTGKRVVITDIRLLLFSPIDLRGVPVPDENREFTSWLKPKILDLDPDDEVINILFLDELSAAPQSVQAAAYQLTLNRCIGEHKLPDNTIVMAAGNRTTDGAVAYKMPSPLANRLSHYEITTDFASWSRWAISEGNVHPLVLGYLSFDTSKLCPEITSYEEKAFPTPRSWMFVSNILHALGSDIDDIRNHHAMISSVVGVGTATEFLGWCKVYKDLPSVQDIFAGKSVTCPKSTDALYALVASMTSYAIMDRSLNEELTQEEVNNVCDFCNLLPADFASCFYLNIVSGGFSMKLMKSPSFVTWLRKNRHLLESYSAK